MKKSNLFLGLSMFVVSAVAQAVTIDNAGFEDGFDGWSDDEPSSISGDSNSGSKSAKISGSGGRVDQTVTLSPNTDYVLTAYVEDGGEIGVNLGSSTESTKSSANGWNKVTVNFNSGSATSGEIFGKYYDEEGRFDDFTLTSTGSSNNSDSSGSSDGELEVSKAFDYGTSHANYPASNAIDDNSNWASRWAAHDNGGAVNLVLELDEVKEITEVGISWGRGDSRAHTFEIYARPGTSGDWTKIADTVASGETTDIEIYDVTDFDAQQVRVKAQYNSSGSRWQNITEVKLYGADGDSDGGSGEVDNGNSGGNTDGNSCADSGRILYNGSCEEYSEVYESEHGDIGENDHLISLSPIEMKFDALAAKHVTTNGNGWRHELKIKSSGGYRVAMTELYEEFKAKITANLDPGAKTIVAQHHADTTATITKLYIADLDEGGFENAPDGTESDSVAMNGIFDVYIRLAKEDGSGETKHLLTTIRSGESFDFEEINDHGKVTVKINGRSLDSITVNDSSASYFKFGNYQQAQNPENNEKLESGDSDNDYDDFYEEYFDTSEIIFTEMSYTRTID